MESMGLTRYMSVLMDDALKQARFFDHEFIMPEHLLLSLLRQFSFCQALQEEGVDATKMHEDLVGWLAKQERVPATVKYLPEPSSLFKSMFGAACALAAAADRRQVNVPHFVQAMLGLQNSEAAYLLCRAVGDRQGEFLASVGNFYPLDNAGGGIDMDDDGEYDDDYDDEEGDRRMPQDWHQLVTCISEQVEQHNPLIGREQELDRTIQVLCRAEKNNPLHIGEPGVGKTALVYGLAKRINDGQVPERLKGARIYSMDIFQMLAGAQFRGDFEKRIQLVMDGATKEGNTIIYLDEIHNIIGAGRGGDGGPDAANQLKRFLEQGDIRFIGSTTYEEYNRYMSKSKSIVRRFQQIDIKEPTEEEALRILEGLQHKYNKYHGVTYRKEALEYAVHASAKYITNRYLPDKAIDLMDEAGAYLEVHPANSRRSYVTKAVVQQILAKVCKIDAAAMKGDNQDNEALATLRQRMIDKIYGQDVAVDKVVEAVMMAKAGLVDDDKPLASLLFVGPTGVGKTEVARSLAKELGVELVRFDMSEYMEKHTVAKLIGSPAGYIGYEDGGLLTDAIRKTPNCVLLLDEIEKAHSDIYNILLQVMDYARLTDNKGQKADFRNVILIMTSNAGAQYASRASVGFNGHVSRGEAMLAQVKKTFKPEFVNRLSDMVVFHDMDEKMAELILDKKLGQLEEKLAARNVAIELTDAAKRQLLKWGFTKEYGAREMDRAIGNRLKPLLMKAMLFGKLKKGGKAVVDFDGKELVAKDFCLLKK